MGLLAHDAARPDSVETNGRIVQDSPRLSAAIGAAIADDSLRRGLRDEMALLAAHSDEVLGRWAAVMLNADVYAEVIDRHVEPARRIVVITQLAEELDRTTLDLALRIVPLEWWQARLGANAPPDQART